MARVTRQQIYQAADRYGIPRGVFYAMISAESGGRTDAKSSAGAIGPAQLMPRTASGLGVNPYDPIENLDGGARYLSNHFKKYNDWSLALAAYNAGGGAVDRYGGIPPFKETQSYVRKIMSNISSGGQGSRYLSTSANQTLPPSSDIGDLSFRDQILAGMFEKVNPRALGLLGAPASSSEQLGTPPPSQQATGLDASFSERLNALVAAVPGLSISSGFRSVAQQAGLYQNAIKKYGSPEAARKWVAPPGKSRHNMGLAADLSGNLELAQKLAPQFGLSFPMSYEPWHVELAGAR